MKYVANPVEVDAHQIFEVFPKQTDGSCVLRISEDGMYFRAEPEMMSRMTPVVGDYVVVQSDGYTYLNPKDVFERNYRPCVAADTETKS